MCLQLPLVRPACLGGDRHLQHTLMGISHRVEQPVQTIHQCLKQVKVNMHVLIMMGTRLLSTCIANQIHSITNCREMYEKSREKGAPPSGLSTLSAVLSPGVVAATHGLSWKCLMTMCPCGFNVAAADGVHAHSAAASGRLDSSRCAGSFMTLSACAHRQVSV